MENRTCYSIGDSSSQRSQKKTKESSAPPDIPKTNSEESDAKFRIIMIEITGFSTAPIGKGNASSKERLGGSCEIVF